MGRDRRPRPIPSDLRLGRGALEISEAASPLDQMRHSFRMRVAPVENLTVVAFPAMEIDVYQPSPPAERRQAHYFIVALRDATIRACEARRVP